jgi:hypothetical protein
MPYSPIHSPDEDDFSHLPTVDALPVERPVEPPESECPPAAVEALEGLDQEAWSQPEFDGTGSAAGQPEAEWAGAAQEPSAGEEQSWPVEASAASWTEEPAAEAPAQTDTDDDWPPLIEEWHGAAKRAALEKAPSPVHHQQPSPSVERGLSDLAHAGPESAGNEVPQEGAAQDDTRQILPIDRSEPEEPADNSGEIQEAKKRAIYWAAGIHLGVLLLLALLTVRPPPRPVSEIVAISERERETQPAWKKIAPPNPTAQPARMTIPIVAAGVSQVVMPEVDVSLTTTELNVGSSFGQFGAGASGTGGGSVNFLGNQGSGNNIVFVVDVSGSMSATAEVNGKIISRMDLLKQELAKAIGQLRANARYQIIYFSHFAWPHDEVDTNDPQALSRYEWDIRPGQTGVRIPTFRYLTATPANINRSKKIIADSTNPGGTNWGSGLLMALNGKPKPDTVFFMTDGNRFDASTWVEEVTAHNHGSGKPAIIHTTAMMSPTAADALDEMARKNGGKFTVVLGDGKVIKSSEFFKPASAD